MGMDMTEEQVTGFAKEPAAMVDDFVAAEVKVFIVGWDAETTTGNPPLPNDHLKELVDEFKDTVIGAFGCVDPNKGEPAIVEAQRCIKQLGFKGLKFHPPAQGFRPNDKTFYPLWEALDELGAILQFHTGTTGLGAGAGGGGGVHLEYGRPVHLDDVAADFPNLKIILCHPGWPWPEENLMILLHKANVFMDLSGWAPKYFPEPLKKDMKGRLKDKVMFGSDYPLIPYERLFAEYEQMNIPDDILEGIFWKNAVRILEIPESLLETKLNENGDEHERN
jgi:predicted TIM-barrel fold metal-dependent hydrolase